MTRGYRFANALATKIAGRFSASRLRTKSDRLLAQRSLRRRAALLLIPVLFVIDVGAQETWVWRRPTPTGNDLSGIAYGNGTWVAVGLLGTILSSEDGRNWGLQNADTENHLNAVVLGNDEFVAVGDSGTVLTSFNGSDWIKQSLRFSTNLLGVAYGNGQYVAISLDGIIVVSPDARDWLKVSLDEIPIKLELMVDIAFGNGRFIVTAQDGAVIISEDGRSWERIETGAVSVVGFVEYSDGIFLYGGIYGEIYSSTDGFAWVQQSPPNEDPASELLNRPIYDLTYGSGHWVAVGASFPGGFSIAFTLGSGGGLEWSNEEIFAESALNGVHSANGVFVAVGNGGLIQFTDKPAVRRAKVTDGGFWDAVFAVASRPDRFAAVGSNSSVLTSTDGIAWSAWPQTWEYGQAILADGQRFIAAVLDILHPSFPTSSIRTSEDGINWTRHQFFNRVWLTSIARSDKVFLTGGYEVTGDDPAMRSSRIYQSTDAEDWSLTNADVPYAVLDIVLGKEETGGTLWVAVGAGNEILTSTNRTGLAANRTESRECNPGGRNLCRIKICGCGNHHF